jgi:hypothetical protein
MKQTAVEWYEKEINSLLEKYESKEISTLDFIIIKHNLFDTAKEMEKQQIFDAYEKGFFDERNGKSPDEEKYYNQTFKK